jgi:hypothetical protein
MIHSKTVVRRHGKLRLQTCRLFATSSLPHMAALHVKGMIDDCNIWH